MEPHFRAADMVAVCGNCHRAVGKLGRDIQYQMKRNSKNAQSGLFRGALVFDKRDLVFKVGGSWYENTPVVLQYRDIPLIACRIEDGQAQVSLNLLDAHGQPLLLINDNEITFRVDDLWDFEYAHNLAIARHGPRDIALKIDLRNPEAIIEGKLFAGGSLINLGPSETTLPRANVLRGNRFKNCPVGIMIA